MTYHKGERNDIPADVWEILLETVKCHRDDHTFCTYLNTTAIALELEFAKLREAKE